MVTSGLYISVRYGRYFLGHPECPKSAIHPPGVLVQEVYDVATPGMVESQWWNGGNRLVGMVENWWNPDTPVAYRLKAMPRTIKPTTTAAAVPQDMPDNEERSRAIDPSDEGVESLAMVESEPMLESNGPAADRMPAAYAAEDG